MLCLPNGILSVGGNLDVLAAFLFATHVTEQTRLALVNLGRPHLLFWLGRQTQRICRSARSIQLRAAGVEYGSTIRSNLQRCDPLAVIPQVARDLPPDIFGGRGNPDVVRGSDRKSTRLNSSHVSISYAVFCLK